MICPICGKKNVKSLKRHYQVSHPDAEFPQEQPQPQEQAQPEQELPFGIDPSQAMSFLEPLIAKAVNETLNKMNLTEQVRQAASESAKAQVTAVAKEIEKALPTIVEQRIAAMVQQAQEQPAEQPQPLAGGQANIAQIAQLWRLLKGDSTGSLEQVNKTMEMASNLANIFMRPYIEGQQAARRELNETIKLVTSIQKLSPDVRDKMFGETK
jgi:HPt (histidine-containing phosphotransfer) domain-containing protein